MWGYRDEGRGKEERERGAWRHKGYTCSSASTVSFQIFQVCKPLLNLRQFLKENDSN